MPRDGRADGTVVLALTSSDLGHISADLESTRVCHLG